MKKAFSLLVALSLCLSLCACSQNSEPAPVEPPAPVAEEPVAEQPVAEEPSVGLVNPMTEVSAAQVLEEMGLELGYMSEYENARFFQYNTDPAIAEVQFSHEGREYSYRVATPAAETDISGMHYSTVETTDALVGYNKAALRKGDCGCDIGWYDMVPGVQYSLSCADADAAAGLTDLAVKLYHPTQGEVDGDPNYSGDFSPLFESLMADFVQNYHPGTAGSSLVGAGYAAALADLFTEQQPYADTLAEEVQVFASGLSSNGQENLIAQLMGLKSAYENMRDYGVDILAVAGTTAAHYPWDSETMDTLFATLVTQGSRYAYRARLKEYKAAMDSGKTRQQLSDAGLNFMVGDLSTREVGYTIEDLDGDGICELLLCLIADNDYLRALVLELDTVNSFGFCSQVFMSGERDRLYTCEADIFYHVGSSGAADSFSQFEQYANGQLTELAADGYSVTQFALTPLNEME